MTHKTEIDLQKENLKNYKKAMELLCTASYNLDLRTATSYENGVLDACIWLLGRIIERTRIEIEHEENRPGQMPG